MQLCWQDKLDACLLDDAEWALGADDWQRFADPFPAWDINDHEHGPDCGCDDHQHH